MESNPDTKEDEPSHGTGVSPMLKVTATTAGLTTEDTESTEKP